MFFRWAERRDDEHRERRARPGGATESAWSRPAHNEHPGSENAGQGARREHHQRIANGLKFNVRPRKAVSTRLRPNRGHALNTAGVTRSENYHSPLEQLDPSRNWRKHCNGQTDRQTRSLVPLSAAFLVKRLVNRFHPTVGSTVLSVIEHNVTKSTRTGSGKGRLLRVRLLIPSGIIMERGEERFSLVGLTD